MHEKSIVFDDSTANIMTLNLTSECYTTSRDFAVVDTDPDDVSAIVKVFNADYAQPSARIFIGSQNFSRTSLTENRELGLIISDQLLPPLLFEHPAAGLSVDDSV